MPLDLAIYPAEQSLGDSSAGKLRAGHQGDLMASELNARHYEHTRRGRMFNGANVAAQAVSVALATAYTGLCLYNPIGSKVNLWPVKAGFMLSLAPAAIATIGLIQGYAANGGVTVQGTAIVPAGNFIGAPRASGIALSTATIVTPTWLAQFQAGFTAAALPNFQPPPFEFDDAICIPPGGFIAIGALTAVTGLGYFWWKETAA